MVTKKAPEKEGIITNFFNIITQINLIYLRFIIKMKFKYIEKEYYVDLMK